MLRFSMPAVRGQVRNLINGYNSEIARGIEQIPGYKDYEALYGRHDITITTDPPLNNFIGNLIYGHRVSAIDVPVQFRYQTIMDIEQILEDTGGTCNDPLPRLGDYIDDEADEEPMRRTLSQFQKELINIGERELIMLGERVLINLEERD